LVAGVEIPDTIRSLSIGICLLAIGDVILRACCFGSVDDERGAFGTGCSAEIEVLVKTIQRNRLQAIITVKMEVA
jgi:hypothetical protein